jgi:hypothetical protein
MFRVDTFPLEHVDVATQPCTGIRATRYLAMLAALRTHSTPNPNHRNSSQLKLGSDTARQTM